MNNFTLPLALSASLFAASASAADVSLEGEAQIKLEDLLWKARPLVVFAPSQDDPRFLTQMEWIEKGAQDLEERDIQVLVDTDPGTLSALREKLRPRDFMLVLIGKDGDVKLRKPFPWTIRELSRVIDKMPMRQQEMRNR